MRHAASENARRDRIDQYSLGTTSYREIRPSDLPGGMSLPGRSFFFGLVENGTAQITEGECTCPLRRGDLLLLSPSRSCTLHTGSRDFAMTGIGILPDFFDTLPDSQPMYGAFGRRFGAFALPVLHPDTATWEHLRRTASLFSDAADRFGTCREGIIRHLCSLFLLEVTEVLHLGNPEPPTGIKRADKLFREFKRLSMEHFRTHHDIAFYADRLHISTTYLSRIVKRTTGHTVYAHLAELLGAEARKELTNTEREIKEIADGLGFSDQSSFGKFFRTRTRTAW